MHETMVAQSIFESILELANEHNALALEATVSCGQFNPINDEVLSFAFDLIAKDSPCEGMKLNIKHIPLKADCKQCGKRFDYDVYKPGCPQCNSMEFDFKEDAPLLLEEIELEPIEPN
jgi:hydrogenase nickel incorporation protein HypA/HybF